MVLPHSLCYARSSMFTGRLAGSISYTTLLYLRVDQRQLLLYLWITAHFAEGPVVSIGVRPAVVGCRRLGRRF